MELIRSGVDAFGSAFLDHLKSGEETVTKVIRLDDGYTEDMSSSSYFQTYEEWIPLDRALTQWIEGRVLDVGVGAGRLALYLQEKGLEVVGIDLSPGAVKVSQMRGVRDVRLHNILDGPLDGEKFRTIVLFGHNLGIAGVHKNVGPFLEILKEMLTPDGRIIVTQLNWERTTKPKHLAFQETNRNAGRHPVEFTLRITYGELEEDFSWCLTNQVELKEIAKSVGLVPEVMIDCGETYGCVLRQSEYQEHK